MELLLLLLIIPLMPFYIFSTVLSAWIFLLGIPFIIFAALLAFCRGLITAIFSRRIYPYLKKLQERFKRMRNSGRWEDEDPSNGIRLAHTNHARTVDFDLPTLSDRETVNSPVLQMQSVFTRLGLNPFEYSSTKLLHYLLYSVQGLDSAVESDSNIELDCLLNEDERSRNDQIERLFHQRFETGPSKSAHQDLFEQMADTIPFFPYELSPPQQSNPPNKLVNVSSKYPDSELSLFTARTNQSFLDSLAEVSSTLQMQNMSLFDEMACVVDEEYISPSDSASQYPSERSSNFGHDGSRADAMDAAKLLSMFAAPVSRNTISEEVY